MSLSDQLTKLETRVEKLEDHVQKISNKIFDGFEERINRIETSLQDLKSLLTKLLVTMFGFGGIGVIISLIWKFLERGK